MMVNVVVLGMHFMKKDIPNGNCIIFLNMIVSILNRVTLKITSPNIVQ